MFTYFLTSEERERKREAEMNKAKKEYNTACREGRVLMLKNVPKKMDLKELRQFLEKDAPISKLTSSLMKTKPNYLQVYITFEQADHLPKVMRRLQSSDYVKKKKIFPALVSPMGGASQRLGKG